jgi:hypothetical protein
MLSLWLKPRHHRLPLPIMKNRDVKTCGDSPLLKTAGKILTELLDTPRTARLYPKSYN